MTLEDKKTNIKTNEVAVKTIAALLLIAFFISAGYFSFRFIRCFSSSKIVGYTPNYEQIHFTIYGSSEGTISGKFILFDTSNKEIAAIERSWNSQNLSIVFESAVFNKREYIFPSRIVGDRNYGRKGTSLSPYYMENKHCLLLSKSFTEKQKKALYSLGVFALKSKLNFFYSFSKETIVDLSGCFPGIEYYISISQDGSINLFPVT